MLYFASDLRELAKVSDINGGSVAWERLRLDDEAKAKVGLHQVGQDHQLTFMRVGDGTGALTIQIAPGDAITASLDDEGVLSIQYVAEATLGEIVEMLKDNESLSNEVFVGTAHGDAACR